MIRRSIGVALLAGALDIASASAHDTFRVMGTITASDGQSAHIATKGGPATVRYYFNTAVNRDKKPATTADLKPGLFVVVEASGHGLDDLLALEFNLVPPPQQ